MTTPTQTVGAESRYSLSDYNSGHSHGVWIDLDSDTDRADIHQAIEATLLSSRNQPAEEWAAHDYDGIPPSFGEHPDLDDVLEFVKGVEEHGDAFRAWMNDRGVTNFIHEDFQDKYAGEADSELAWIESHLEETGALNDVPENLRSYVDAEAYLRDMTLGGAVPLRSTTGPPTCFGAELGLTLVPAPSKVRGGSSKRQIARVAYFAFSA